MVVDDVAQRLTRSMAAGARGFLLVTREEERAIGILDEVARLRGIAMRTWSAAAGPDTASEPIEELLVRLSTSGAEELWVVLDGAESIHRADQLRALRNVARRSFGPAVVVVGPRVGMLDRVPELIASTLPLPDAAELKEHITWIGGVLEESGHHGAAVELTSSAERLATSALGLELREVERLVAEAVLHRGISAEGIARMVTEAKRAIIDSGALLEAVVPAPLESMGGLEAFKRWTRRRALALDPAARRAAIPPPRGVLLIGVQGCGKSLAARVCASIMDLPLVRLEPGRLFAGTVGESEANLRRATSTAERLAPVALWIDEIDKGFAGAESATSDAGTAARVLGGLLTWMQERTRPVFVIATANRIDALPPELLRRGRLDEIFFVDLPGPDEREAILHVHLEEMPRRELGQKPPLADPPQRFAVVVRAAEGYSGAEIEAALVEARLQAWSEQRPLAAADFEQALHASVPLSRTRAESIDALRRWAHGRARRA